MSYNDLLTASRWNIIKELSHEDLSATDLAKSTKTSIANISQQLRLLEAYGFVSKGLRINNKNNIGKPKTKYFISKEIIETTIISKHYCDKKSLELDYVQKAILNLWLHSKKEDYYYLEKFLTMFEEVTEKCQAIQVVKSTTNSIELLIITESIQEIRQKYSNQKIKNLQGDEKTIICWTHNMKEIEEGLKQKEEHFIQLTSNNKPFLDKQDIFTKIKKIQNES